MQFPVYLCARLLVLYGPVCAHEMRMRYEHGHPGREIGKITYEYREVIYSWAKSFCCDNNMESVSARN